MTSRITREQRETVPGAAGVRGAEPSRTTGASGAPDAPFGHGRSASVLLALLLMMASVPVAAGESVLAIAIAAILGAAGGLSLRNPLIAGAIIGLTFTFAVFAGPAHVGPGSLASIVAIASAAGHGKILGAIMMSVWHVTTLMAISAVRGDEAAYMVSELLLWIVLQGGTLVAATWGRRLFERSVAERARRLSELSDQRRAIARELHDTGVRAMTEVVMLAENGALHPGTAPSTAAEFRRISSTSRRAADEMRELLEQLRGSHEVGSPAHARGACVEDLLEMLRGRLAAAGFSVRVASEGECSLPDREVAVIARCLEEVEANVVRHGDRAAPVAIMSESLPGSSVAEPGLRLAVLNGMAPDDRHGLSGGAGLEGVRERLAAVGGDLEARCEGSTFLTRIDIPGEIR